EAATRYGLDPEKLPPFVHVGDVVGHVTRPAARRFGLSAGVPVVAGGSDFIVSLLGTGAVDPGVTCDRAGTSEGVNYCSAAPVDDPRLRCLPHPVPGFYNVAGVLSSTGTIFEWFRDISGQKKRSYAEMLADIRSVDDHVHVPWFFPSLHEGAAWEFSRGMFIDLGADHGPKEMGRAVVESIGYAVREVIDVLEQNGCRVGELRVCGGQGRNEIWSQMKANMVGRPLAIVEVVDAELLGNACAAYVGLGRFGSVAEASRALVRIARRYDPQAHRLTPYEERYHRYRDAYGRFRLALKECDLL
ncbi:MAG: carbohydrate kinase, partial [Spirochaetes bacterium]|nr:carbohydrate kinase [Spirochaetota bacterium]